MALTTLDPNTALLVVDLQKGVMGSPTLHPIGEVVERARVLIDAFRARRLPVVLINAAGGAPGRTEQPPRLRPPFPEGFTDFIPELGQQPDDLVVTKRTWGAFASTELEARLKALGVTQVVVLGIATGTGVESTARQAYEAGFNVTLAVDAMTDTRPEAHDYSLRKVFPRLGESGATHEIVDLLDKRSA
jgi:nicotinamidase-related amidase